VDVVVIGRRGLIDRKFKIHEINVNLQNVKFLSNFSIGLNLAGIKFKF